MTQIEKTKVVNQHVYGLVKKAETPRQAINALREELKLALAGLPDEMLNQIITRSE